MKCQIYATVCRMVYHWEPRIGSVSRQFDPHKRENDRVFNTQLKRIIEGTSKLQECQFLYWDNVVHSVANAFIISIKYYGRNREARQYIKALEEENLEIKSLNNCSSWVRAFEKIIFGCLCCKKGEILYQVLLVMKNW